MEEKRLRDSNSSSVGEAIPVKPHFCSTIAVYPSSPEGSRDIVLKTPIRKFLWVAGSAAWGQNEFSCVYGTPEEYLAPSNVAIATTSLWPELWKESEPDSKLWRGIFNPIYDRKVLFSEEVVLRIADLPRWQPKVMIDRRTLERENE
jgi:hypothetical protein